MKIGDTLAQGDVLLVRVAARSVTKAHKPAARDVHGRIVVASGEASGHHHVFRAQGVCLLVNENSRILTVTSPCQLLHDLGEENYIATGDHGPVDVPAGTYRVVMQREWVGQGSQNVAD